MYHGASDPAIPASRSTLFYQQLVTRLHGIDKVAAALGAVRAQEARWAFLKLSTQRASSRKNALDKQSYDRQRQSQKHERQCASDNCVDHVYS